MKRQIINIDAEKCTGCGQCIPGCPEGAISIVDGKARLISDLFCDGLGACLGQCPEGAITIEEREAEPYDEAKVMENIVKQGVNVIKEHLHHLQSHGQTQYFTQALEFLKKHNIDILTGEKTGDEGSTPKPMACGCPGSQMRDFAPATTNSAGQINGASQLTQWPVQGHLISPAAPYFHGSDVLLSADCVAYALGDFHANYLKGKKLVIACPKLDSNLDVYVEKIRLLIDEAKINTLTVMIMQVPCCNGLLHIAKEALKAASRKVPIKAIVVGVQGDILANDWV
ncbi:MAG: 4Fe-4S binding protein [Candidatus Magnetoovum sp. WYHC-5]|nr:4Fe-4S binding protein [Candidatus Magnetoovum sp. WYHC-5]